MIDGQEVSTYDPERFGAWGLIAIRWKQVVNILDAFIPNWSLGEERKTSEALGAYAGSAIHRVVQERDALKAERDALATECAALYESRDAARKEVEELKTQLKVKQAFLSMNREGRREAAAAAAQLRAKLREFGELLTKAGS